MQTELGSGTMSKLGLGANYWHQSYQVRRAVPSVTRGANMDASAAARGKSATEQCDVVRATSTAIAEARRSRMAYMVAQRPRRLGATTVEAPWRVARRRDTAAHRPAGCYCERLLVPEVQRRRTWRRDDDNMAGLLSACRVAMSWLRG